jgi:hypothetical protein
MEVESRVITGEAGMRYESRQLTRHFTQAFGISSRYDEQYR